MSLVLFGKEIPADLFASLFFINQFINFNIPFIDSFFWIIYCRCSIWLGPEMEPKKFISFATEKQQPSLWPVSSLIFFFGHSR